MRRAIFYVSLVLVASLSVWISYWAGYARGLTGGLKMDYQSTYGLVQQLILHESEISEGGNVAIKLYDELIDTGFKHLSSKRMILDGITTQGIIAESFMGHAEFDEIYSLPISAEEKLHEIRGKLRGSKSTASPTN